MIMAQKILTNLSILYGSAGDDGDAATDGGGNRYLTELVRSLPLITFSYFITMLLCVNVCRWIAGWQPYPTSTVCLRSRPSKPPMRAPCRWSATSPEKSPKEETSSILSPKKSSLSSKLLLYVCMCVCIYMNATCKTQTTIFRVALCH